MSNQHIWNFSTVGGVKRVNLESGNDLLHLEELDQKLWTALSCPVNGLEIDHKTLSLMDTDNDGQLRVPEVIAAVKWICSVINNPNDLLRQENALPLSAIKTNTELGVNLLGSAKTILKNLKQENSERIDVSQTSNTTAIFAGTAFNGDGIITPNSSNNSELAELIKVIGEIAGFVKDRSGEDGISQTQIENFFKWSQSYLKWHKKGQSDKETIFVLGEQTADAYASLLAIKSKVNDYFIRCKLAAFDEESTKALNQLSARVEQISPKDLSESLNEIANYPLAKITSNTNLPLLKGINPAWEHQVSEFKRLVVDTLQKGKEEITESDWIKLCSKFAEYEKWSSEKKGAQVEPLGVEKINQLVSGNFKAELEELIKQDLDLADEADGIILVDKLVRYYCDLFRLLKNFVTFYDFYSPGSNAIFLAGTLFIDQRSCDLCIKVNDMGKHNMMVSLSGMYLMYCDCVSKSGGEKMTIVAALTNGDIDNLVVGKNAIFYDKNGVDWDATVTKIVENPISIRQAFWSPYRKVARFIETQVEKFASAKEKEGLDKATGSIETAGSKINEAPKAPPQPFDIGKFVGIFAAIGLAFGAIGSVLASFISGFLGLVWWKMPIAFVGLVLAISGPSMIIAWLKLRKRNLAPILDANGWAINASAVVNIPFGNTLTHLAILPKGAKVNLNDPFTKKKTPVWLILIALLLIAGALFYLLCQLGYMHLPA